MKARPGDGRVLERAVDNVSRLRATCKGLDDGLRAFSRAMDKRLELVTEYAVAADQHIDQLEDRVAQADEHAERLRSQLESAETQTTRLMSLYVASDQLNATLEPLGVQKAIAEITVSLLGADHFALLLRDEQGAFRIAYSDGIDGSSVPSFADSTYTMGDPVIDCALVKGTICVGPQEGSCAIAAAPLRLEDKTVGALVLFKLLDHKPTLTSEDRELLELLASRAAPALALAQMYARARRKLGTLESLVASVPRSQVRPSTPRAPRSQRRSGNAP